MSEQSNQTYEEATEEDLPEQEPPRRPWIVRHFRAYTRRGPWSFCLLITLEGLAVSLGLIIALTALFDLPETDSAPDIMRVIG